MVTRAEFEATVDRLTKELTDKGLLLEAGFMTFRRHFMSPEASEGQIAHARLAFLLGAQHLFGSIVGILEEGAEPTDNDMRRMSLIAGELERFTTELHKRTAKGRA